MDSLTRIDKKLDKLTQIVEQIISPTENKATPNFD